MPQRQIFTGNKPKYEAFGEQGPYWREARIIDELPYSDHKAAINAAKEVLGLDVKYGEKIMHTNKLSPNDVASDGRSALLLRGSDLPLDLIWKS